VIKIDHAVGVRPRHRSSVIGRSLAVAVTLALIGGASAGRGGARG